MKILKIIGFVAAILLHLAILLFGGIILPHSDAKKADAQVELVSDVAEDKPDEKKEPEEKKEEVAEQKDAPPDASEVVRNLEPAASEPALSAVSLSDLEAALNGAGGDESFGGALSFASGGRIGGKGAAGSSAQGDAADEAFASGDLDQKPRAIFQSPPAYPAELRGKKMEGVVQVFFIIDAQGRVVDPRVEQSPHPAFSKPALDAIKKWRFEPAMRGGKKVASKMKVPIRFQGA